MWEFKTYAYYARLLCPALIIPAYPSEPHSLQEQEYLALKKRGVARAQETNQDVRVHWMEDTIHDIPLQRAAELAAVLAEFVNGLK
jgi:hypothetical protein